MQVDWVGDTASVFATDTGKVIPVYVFVATLPYSDYSYVKAFFSINQESWTTAHVNAYKYFGGVTWIIQCGNLKTGVQRHGKTEVVLNKSYQELAEHYGTAILPARVRSSKDKAAFEGTVGIASTFILAALRNHQFLFLPELNEAIGKRLEAFKQSRSRNEKAANTRSICLWNRKCMSSGMENVSSFRMERLAVTRRGGHAILSGYKGESQGYKSCIGFLKLTDKYNPERLKNVCKQTLEYTPRPSLKNIQAILASGQDKAVSEQSMATASSQYEFTRGAEYYGRGNK